MPNQWAAIDSFSMLRRTPPPSDWAGVDVCSRTLREESFEGVLLAHCTQIPIKWKEMEKYGVCLSAQIDINKRGLDGGILLVFWGWERDEAIC